MNSYRKRNKSDMRNKTKMIFIRQGHYNNVMRTKDDN